MNREKLIITSSLFVILVLCVFFGIRSILEKSSPNVAAQVGVLSAPVALQTPTTGNAFVRSTESNVFLPDPNDIAQSSSLSSVTRSSAATSGKDTNLSIPAGSSLNSPASPSASQVTALTLPDVSDSAVAIDAGGASSPLEYVIALNENYKKIAFDSGRFDAVLKDSYGEPLFILPLVEKARTDNDFSEIRDSLKVQKDFANADISLMSSIKVASGALAFDKKVIGTEELTVQLADKALAVSSGSLSRQNFENFYSSFLETAGQVNSEYANEVGAVSSVKSSQGGWAYNIFSVVSPVAHAQVVTTPFGGQILTIVPAILAVIVSIGPPMPAVIIVPDVFLATPLFFLVKSLVIGSWSVGTYNTESGEVIMMGTSLPAP